MGWRGIIGVLRLRLAQSARQPLLRMTGFVGGWTVWLGDVQAGEDRDFDCVEDESEDQCGD